MSAYAPLLQMVRDSQEKHRDDFSDGELLRLFLAKPEQSTFAMLVQRHGTMVFHVCRRVLGRSHDVEDAFQATFLVLVQKAKQLQHRDTVGDWLHGVAYHTALKARAMITRRLNRERHAAKPVVVLSTFDSETWRQILDEEIRKLPIRYRQALVLCDLEQMTRKEAAKSLGCFEGTVASRLARGREMLGKRLRSRGIEITSALIALELAAPVQALPLPLMQTITQAACKLASGASVVCAASAQIARLMKAGLAGSLTHKAAILVSALALSIGLSGWLSMSAIPQQPHHPPMISAASTSTPAGTPARQRSISPARKMEPIMLAEMDDPPLRTRQLSGSDEDILFELGLSDDQLLQFLIVRDILHEQTQEMYKLAKGKRERGLEINRDWNASLMQIMTPEQYLGYCQYWDDRTFRASR